MKIILFTVFILLESMSLASSMENFGWSFKVEDTRKIVGDAFKQEPDDLFGLLMRSREDTMFSVVARLNINGLIGKAKVTRAFFAELAFSGDLGKSVNYIFACQIEDGRVIIAELLLRAHSRATVWLPSELRAFKLFEETVAQTPNEVVEFVGSLGADARMKKIGVIHTFNEGQSNMAIFGYGEGDNDIDKNAKAYQILKAVDHIGLYANSFLRAAKSLGVMENFLSSEEDGVQP